MRRKGKDPVLLEWDMKGKNIKQVIHFIKRLAQKEIVLSLKRSKMKCLEKRYMKNSHNWKIKNCMIVDL